MLTNRNFLVLNFNKLIFAIVFLSVGLFPSLVNAARQPDVITEGVSFVSNDSATLTGSVDGNDSPTRVWFEYGTNKDMTKTTLRQSMGEDYANFSIDIEDLRDDTLYYYRAVAKNSAGTDYGVVSSFRTDSDNTNSEDNSSPQAPTVTTIIATEITDRGAQLNSLVLEKGNNFTNSWFEWGRTPNLGTKTEVVSIEMLSETRHAHSLSGLAPNTTYYFRAMAENSYWKSIGVVLSFKTDAKNTEQSNTITYIAEEEPTPTVEEVEEEEATTTTSPDSETVTEKTETASSLVANTFAVGSFLPRNIIGWLMLFVLALFVINLVKDPQIIFAHNKSDGKGHISDTDK